MGRLMKIKAFTLCFSFIFLFGCTASVRHYLLYDINLEEVERPPEAFDLFEKQKISTTEEEGFTFLFEDEMIRILWRPSPVEMSFLLENKTDNSIRIIWNEAAYVSKKGKSYRVIHTGVKPVERDRPQVPSVIEKEGVLKDYVYPADYVSYSHDDWVERPLYMGWDENPFLPYTQKGGDPQVLLNSAQGYLGKTLQVLLPIQYKNVTYNYIFTFKIKDVYLAPK